MKDNNNVARFTSSIIFFMCVFFSQYLFSITVQCIENPNPTHVEENFKTLVVINEISSDFSEKNFMADPLSLTVDNEGCLYVFDRKIQKVFKFSSDFKFVNTFGKTGRGPREYDQSPIASKQLYFSENGLIYLSDARNKKILAYDKKGNYIKEIPIPGYQPRLVPVIDKAGRYYLPSEIGAIDIYNPKGNKTHTLLSKDAYYRFILMEPPSNSLDLALKASPSNTFYDFICENKRILYLRNSSTIYIFDGLKMKKKFDVWPKGLIEKTKKGIANIKKMNPNANFMVSLFHNFFVDKDDENNFYLFPGGTYKKQIVLYKLNLQGVLLEVLCIDRKKYGPLQVLAKRNDLFWAISRNGDIKILKKEKL
jgi:hypothetical protein